MKTTKKVMAVSMAAIIMTGSMPLQNTYGAANEETQETASGGYEESGLKGKKKLTVRQLVNLYESITKYGNKLYKTKPVIGNGKYKISALTAKAYKNGLDNINYYRTVAGLDKVSFTATLNKSAAYGAMLNAATGVLSHFPVKPSDMENTLYKKGYYATSHSNISFSYGYSIEDVINLSIGGQMADAYGSNVTVLGHRRWLLDPYTKTMGIGVANNANEEFYASVRVMGKNVKRKNTLDYNFIAWPSSGNNLSDTFEKDNPWSVTLNPDVYTIPTSTKGLKVTITQKRDGKKWTFSSKTNNTIVDGRHSFFRLDNVGYGIDNCLIFRPAYSKLKKYKGDYVVKITGLKDKKGKKKNLTYKVSFVSYEEMKNK